MFSEKKKKRLSAGLLILALVVMGAITWLVGGPMIRFAEKPEVFRAWVEEKGIWGQLIFLGMMLLQVVIALIPGEPLEIAAGYAFGAVEGTLLCMLATTLGGTLVFLLVRKWGVRVLELFFQKERIESLKFMQNTPKVRVIAFFLMFLPGTPKDLLSYFMGLTKIRLSEWIVLSTVARIPSIVTSTVGGNALGGQDYTLAIIVFAVTLVISLAGGAVYSAYTRRHSGKEGDS
ncbi:MAG: TVP38/TMEM64 family protein [Candidatus Faecousia sp.]|nr:TVP38/TMEM64 family protein [Bacillota bacterium]MDY4220649.1 TVP38/TMEM64 family protein [Candidatus Faecousia sp.]